MAFNTRPLDWESSALTSKPLLHKYLSLNPEYLLLHISTVRLLIALTLYYFIELLSFILEYAETTYGSRCSRMDQVKYVEESL